MGRGLGINNTRTSDSLIYRNQEFVLSKRGVNQGDLVQGCGQVVTNRSREGTKSSRGHVASGLSPTRREGLIYDSGAGTVTVSGVMNEI